MHPYLTKLLAKRKIADKESMTGEEKEVFENYERVLSKEELTLEDLKVFLNQQIGAIEAKWRNYDVSEKQKADLIPYHTCYKTLLGAISSPMAEREALEKYLEQLIK